MNTMIRNFCLLSVVVFFPALSMAQSDVGLGVGVSPWDTSPRKKDKNPRPADTYIVVLAERFNVKQDTLTGLWNKGYGRNELIKLLLIARKSDKDILDLAKKRDKGIKFSRIAEEYKLDYRDIMQEAGALRKDVDYQVSVSTPTFLIDASTPTAEGGSDR